jgi:hypothetical protein
MKILNSNYSYTIEQTFAITYMYLDPTIWIKWKVSMRHPCLDSWGIARPIFADHVSQKTLCIGIWCLIFRLRISFFTSKYVWCILGLSHWSLELTLYLHRPNLIFYVIGSRTNWSNDNYSSLIVQRFKFHRDWFFLVPCSIANNEVIIITTILLVYQWKFQNRMVTKALSI